MNIGIIDADLLGQKNHNFPNLALMKLSGYYKAFGHNVELISYQDISPNVFFRKNYDKIFISKVFTNTTIPDGILDLPNVEYGGTGFFYDKAPRLPNEIEHHFPDYNLYDKWINSKIRFDKKRKEYFKYYTDYSIGFTTRGCFRQCEFCVNRNETRVVIHSPLSEFVLSTRKKICLLDDNVFGTGHWEKIFKELQATKKPFQYKQGLDVRILTERKAISLSKSKYDGDYIFAFDNYKDRVLIEDKIKLFKQYLPKIVPKFYVFCAFDSDNVYDENFWVKDITELFERIKILLSYGCIPYVMKFEKYRFSPYAILYSYISSWSAPIIIKKQTFYEYHKDKKSLVRFINKYPEIADKYFNIRFNTINS